MRAAIKKGITFLIKRNLIELIGFDIIALKIFYFQIYAQILAVYQYTLSVLKMCFDRFLYLLRQFTRLEKSYELLY